MKTTKKSNNEPITYSYDDRLITAIEQHEIMLVSIYNVFRDEIKKELLKVSSKNNAMMGLNCITIELSSKMNRATVNAILEAINTTAYYSLLPNERGEFFEMMAKENK